MELLKGLRRSRDETHLHLRITCDANEESGVGEVVDEISGPTRKNFATKNYGLSLLGIGVVLICRNPELKFKQRLKFSKSEKRLYMDVMLDLGQMRQADHERRKRIICERLAEEIPAVVRKYSVPDFDEERFAADLKSWLAEIGSMQP
jgi:hypothetical protein